MAQQPVSMNAVLNSIKDPKDRRAVHQVFRAMYADLQALQAAVNTLQPGAVSTLYTQP